MRLKDFLECVKLHELREDSELFVFEQGRVEEITFDKSMGVIGFKTDKLTDALYCKLKELEKVPHTTKRK